MLVLNHKARQAPWSQFLTFLFPGIDEIVRSAYPRKHQERLRQLQRAPLTIQTSRLPGYTATRHVLGPNRRPNQNQPALQLLNLWNNAKNVFENFVWVQVIAVGGAFCWRILRP